MRAVSGATGREIALRPLVSKLPLLLGLLLVAVLLRLTDANPAIAQTQSIGAWQVSAEPIMDGSAPEWQSILPVFLPTTSQQVAPPMGGGAIERVAVRAVHHDDVLYVMLEWSDATADEASDRHEAFSDAAAVQFPAEAGSEVPAICMGQADRAVNIWQWRADQQTELPSLPESGYVDSYPSTDDLFFPAREAGNPLAQSQGRTAVQSLLAGGFGTLEVGGHGGLDGHAVHENGRWMVVFSRPFASGTEMQPSFDGSTPVDVALAVWDGSQQERNGLKSVSAFTRLQITPEDAPRRGVAATDDWPAYSLSNPMVPISIGFTVFLLAVTAALWVYMNRKTRETD
jgi:complex iron-sulfur molybdoenzyme family reductase subunit gamma